MKQTVPSHDYRFLSNLFSLISMSLKAKSKLTKRLLCHQCCLSWIEYFRRPCICQSILFPLSWTVHRQNINCRDNLWKRTLTIAGGRCLRDPRTLCPLPTPSPTLPPTTSRTGSPAVNWYNLLVFNPIRPCLTKFHKVKTRLRSTLDPLRSLSRSDTWQVTKEVPKE